MEEPYATKPSVLDTTDARQGNRKTMNLRVLFGSLVLAAIAGLILVSAFWNATPTSMDATAPAAPTAATAPVEPVKPAPQLPATPPGNTAPATVPQPAP